MAIQSDIPRTDDKKTFTGILIFGIIVIGIVIGLVLLPSQPTVDTIPESPEYEPPEREFSPPREPTEIESMINDITLNNVANKSRYRTNPNRVDDVHVCMNMAVDQALWISDNYDYDTGIVMLWNKHLGDNHAQTWVNVSGTMYVIDSTSSYYWNVENHARHWGDDYKIQFASIKKGLELEKENNEMLNNKDDYVSYPDAHPDVIIVMDISPSMLSDIDHENHNGVSLLHYEKMLVCDILDDDEFRDDRIGIGTFGGTPTIISELQYLNNSEKIVLQNTIMEIWIEGQQCTPLEAGLTMAEEMLANSAGAKDVIILSDGIKIDYASSLAIATEMQENGIRMHFIHVMREPTNDTGDYEKLSRAVDATYYRPTYPRSVTVKTGQFQ